MRLFVARDSSQYWWWDFGGPPSGLGAALERDDTLGRLRAGHTEIPGFAPLIDEAPGSLESLRDQADAVVFVTAAGVRLESRDSAVVLAWAQPRHPPTVVARACLPLVEASLAAAWTPRFPDHREPQLALAEVRRWLGGQEGSLSSAQSLAEKALALASDGYGELLEMNVSWWTIAAARTVALLVRLCEGGAGAGERLALEAARACEPSDTVDAQRRQRRAHGALLQQLL